MSREFSGIWNSREFSRIAGSLFKPFWKQAFLGNSLEFSGSAEWKYWLGFFASMTKKSFINYTRNSSKRKFTFYQSILAWTNFHWIAFELNNGQAWMKFRLFHAYASKYFSVKINMIHFTDWSIHFRVFDDHSSISNITCLTQKQMRK